jgi:DNA-binding NtrC family response regulator
VPEPQTEHQDRDVPGAVERVGGRILVVDDEANARNALVELLTEEGYEVDSASDGRKALERMAASEPEVVLTDLKMPLLDGLELLRLGKQGWPATAVVVMTAFGSIETAVQAIKLGAES